MSNIPADVLNNSSLINISVHSNEQGIDAPNYEKLKVTVAAKKADGKRIRKKHMCDLCDPPSDHTHLKRHLKRKHGQDPRVQKMLQKSVMCKRSRKPMKKLLYAGDFKYNKSKTLNKGNSFNFELNYTYKNFMKYLDSTTRLKRILIMY